MVSPLDHLPAGEDREVWCFALQLAASNPQVMEAYRLSRGIDERNAELLSTEGLAVDFAKWFNETIWSRLDAKHKQKQEDGCKHSHRKLEPSQGT